MDQNSHLSGSQDLHEADIIREAIRECRENIRRHVMRGWRSIFFALVVIGFSLTSIYYFQNNSTRLLIAILEHPGTKTETDAVKTIVENNGKAIYGLFGFCIISLSVGVSLYRYHSKESTRSEHQLLGLLRIYIAASKHEEGYGTDVRRALTEGAFSIETKSGIFGNSDKEKKVESPLPGHPTSDIGTAMLNKMLDAIEFKAETKK